MPLTSPLRAAAPLAVAAALLFSACGSDDDDDAAGGGGDGAATTTTAAAARGLRRREGLPGRAHRAARDRDGQAPRGRPAVLRPRRERRLRLRRSCWPSTPTRSRRSSRSSRQTSATANPAYEEMEGVVAGVPELADYDVIIDAGGDASDPENAVPFTIKTQGGQGVQAARQLLLPRRDRALRHRGRSSPPRASSPTSTATARSRSASRCRTPTSTTAATTTSRRRRRSSTRPARSGRRRAQDVFTALVVMTPTMSEYFEAWKNSRFVAGDKATEKSGFVGASRLRTSPTSSAASSLIYDNVEPQIAEDDPAQAEQTGAVAGRAARLRRRSLRDEETGGKKFTAEDADTLGTEAQEQAEAIAGQVSQAAGQLNIELERLGDLQRTASAGAILRRVLAALVATVAALASRTTPARHGAVEGASDAAAGCALRAIELLDGATRRPRPPRSRAGARGVRRRPRAPIDGADAPGRPRRAARRWTTPSAAGAPTATSAPSPPPAARSARRSLRGSAAVTLSAAGRGDAAVARARGCCCATSAPRRASRAPAPTRRSRSTASATGKLAPKAAHTAVAKDLLDAYQARACASCSTTRTPARGARVRDAPGRGRRPGRRLLADPRARATSRTAARPRPPRMTTAFDALATAAAERDQATSDGALARRHRARWTASPPRRSPSRRRRAAPSSSCASSPSCRSSTAAASPGRRSPLDFEIQEAVAFRTGADRRVRPTSATRSPSATPRARRRSPTTSTQLARSWPTARRAPRTASPEAGEVEAVTDRAEDAASTRSCPKAWKEPTDESDYDLIALTLDRMEAAVGAGQYKQAEQARLEAYAFFEFGPERRLKAFDPGLAIDVEGLIWFGAARPDGPRGADRQARAAPRDARDAPRRSTTRWATPRPRSATARTRRPSSPTPRSSCSARGSRRVLILAAITASFVGAKRPAAPARSSSARCSASSRRCSRGCSPRRCCSRSTSTARSSRRWWASSPSRSCC